MISALIVVDVQRDFCEDGKLAVEGGKEVASKISQFIQDTKDNFYKIVATKDAHIQNENRGHFSSTPDYVDTWPEHCVMGTRGYQFQDPLKWSMFDETFRKGRGVPAYSGFNGVGGRTHLTLEEYLSLYDIEHLCVCGIATSRCVRDTVIDALIKNFKVTVLSNLCVGVSPELHNKTLEEFRQAGVKVL